MTILELNFERDWRGGERQTLYNMQGFRNADIAVHLICRKNSELEKHASQEGFRYSSFSSIMGVILFLISKGKNYTIIHAQTSHILTYCVLTKFIHRQKIVFTRRVNFIQKGFFTKQKYRYTDQLVAISNAIKQTLQQFTGHQNIVVISDIVLPSTTTANELTKSRYRNLLNSGPVLATAAALTYEKDPLTLVKAIRQLAINRKNFSLLHFGSGPLQEAVQAAIDKAGLQQHYHLKGFVNNIEKLYPMFSVFVLTSKEEGLGSSVLDAFIHQVPVVATDAGGLKNLLQDGRGIQCATGDSQAIAAGIELVLTDTEKRNSMVKKAYDYATQFHSMEYITAQYIQLFKTLISQY